MICQVNAVGSVRFGLGQFRRSHYPDIDTSSSDPSGGYIRVPVHDYLDSDGNPSVYTLDGDTQSHADHLDDAIDALEGETWTPLAETLFQVYTYLMSRASSDRPLGADGATHQGLFDYAYLRTLPNAVVMAPKDENELQHLLATAVKYPGPAAIRFPRGAGIGANLDPDVKEILLGEAELLRDGDDVALLAVGNTVHPAVEAAAELANDGLSCAVLNARFVKPLDRERIIDLATRCRAIVTIEEHSAMGGFGGAVLELLSEEGISTPVRTLGVPDRLIEHGESAETLGLAAPDIAAAARALARSAD